MKGLARISVRGPAGRLAVHLGGSARASVVVFGHSILAAGAMWQTQADFLLQRGFRVVCIDTRGHGESEPAPPPYSMSGLVADVVAVLDALRIERAHYIGLSLGGMVGFGLGIEHSSRLSSLLLCDARADAAARGSWDDRIALARKKGCAALAESICERWLGADFVAACPVIAARIRTMVAATSTDGFIGCAHAIQDFDYRVRLDRIAVPVTLLAGARDGQLPAAMHALLGSIAGSRYELIHDAGHLPCLEKPAAFNAAMLRHLETGIR